MGGQSKKIPASRVTSKLDNDWSTSGSLHFWMIGLLLRVDFRLSALGRELAEADTIVTPSHGPPRAFSSKLSWDRMRGGVRRTCEAEKGLWH